MSWIESNRNSLPGRDRSWHSSKNTILQQLLHSEEDPYSRAHLTKKLLETHNMKVSVKSRIDELKSKIDKW